MNRDIPAVMYVITKIILAKSSGTAVDMSHPRYHLARLEPELSNTEEPENKKQKNYRFLRDDKQWL